MLPALLKMGERWAVRCACWRSSLKRWTLLPNAQSAYFPSMSSLRAIYEHGVFRPLETVDLPESSEVLIEPLIVAAPLSPTGRQRIYQILGQRFDSGEDDVAARHDEHQP